MPQRNTARAASPRRNTFSVTLRAGVRAFAPALALGVAGLTVACADGAEGPTAPRAATAGAAGAAVTAAGTTTSGSTLVSVTTLRRTQPLPAAITRSVRLTATGGTLMVPEAGLTVTIPRGAVGDSTATFTVTALAGSQVAYEFGPHGARFATKLKIKQALANTSWAGNTGMTKVAAGYFADPSQLSASTGTAAVSEEIAGTIAGGSFHFDVSHFSGYIMTTGRTR